MKTKRVLHLGRFAVLLFACSRSIAVPTEAATSKLFPTGRETYNANKAGAKCLCCDRWVHANMGRSGNR